MSRGLTPALLAEFEKKLLQPALFVAGQFVSGWVRIWTGLGSVEWDGETWQGVALPNGATLLAISALTETTDLEAQGVKLSLSGIPSEMAQQVINECRHAYPVKIWVGALDQETGEVIADPYVAWAGRMDVPELNDDGTSCTASISVETVLLDLNRVRQWNYTHEDQQVLAPGDLGFEFVGTLQNFAVNWGKGSAVAPAGVVTARRP